MQKEVQKSRNKEVVELFDSGLGIHHAGMLRSDRSLTERFFADGILKVCLMIFLITLSFPILILLAVTYDSLSPFLGSCMHSNFGLGSKLTSAHSCHKG